MPASSQRSGQNSTFQLPSGSLQIAGIAFCAGLLLFLIVWLSTRGDSDFYRAGPVQADKQVQELAPLPEPLAAGAGASDMPDARPQSADEKPQLLEPAAAPVPQALPETPVDAAPVAAADTGMPMPGNLPVPLPDQSPAPHYPAAALRRGESGTVVVRVEVDANGNPAGVALIQRSGSRLLDRTAMEAVRNWRFQPAYNNGQPVPGSLEIPFDFKSAQ